MIDQIMLRKMPRKERRIIIEKEIIEELRYNPLCPVTTQEIKKSICPIIYRCKFPGCKLSIDISKILRSMAALKNPPDWYGGRILKSGDSRCKYIFYPNYIKS